MTLDEFVDAEKRRLETFRDYWRAHQELNTDPEAWKDSMKTQDWMEQFYMFVDAA